MKWLQQGVTVEQGQLHHASDSSMPEWRAPDESHMGDGGRAVSSQAKWQSVSTKDNNAQISDEATGSLLSRLRSEEMLRGKYRSMSADELSARPVRRQMVAGGAEAARFVVQQADPMSTCMAHASCYSCDMGVAAQSAAGAQTSHRSHKRYDTHKSKDTHGTSESRRSSKHGVHSAHNLQRKFSAHSAHHANIARAHSLKPAGGACGSRAAHEDSGFDSNHVHNSQLPCASLLGLRSSAPGTCGSHEDSALRSCGAGGSHTSQPGSQPGRSCACASSNVRELGRGCRHFHSALLGSGQSIGASGDNKRDAEDERDGHRDIEADAARDTGKDAECGNRAPCREEQKAMPYKWVAMNGRGQAKSAGLDAGVGGNAEMATKQLHVDSSGLHDQQERGRKDGELAGGVVVGTFTAPARGNVIQGVRGSAAPRVATDDYGSDHDIGEVIGGMGSATDKQLELDDVIDVLDRWDEFQRRPTETERGALSKMDMRCSELEEAFTASLS